jgi:hypothetical protein
MVVGILNSRNHGAHFGELALSKNGAQYAEAKDGNDNDCENIFH